MRELNYIEQQENIRLAREFFGDIDNIKNHNNIICLIHDPQMEEKSYLNVSTSGLDSDSNTLGIASNLKDTNAVNTSHKGIHTEYMNLEEFRSYY